MATRTLHLVSLRRYSKERAHFGILVPSAADPERGTLINVIGAPLVGFALQFKRNYSPADDSQQPFSMWPIGEVDVEHIVDQTDDARSLDDTPRGKLELVASQVAPPRISENFMAPVNNTTNKRCQEWTTEYVQRLVDLRYIGADALEIVQSKRDPPSHGIGLKPVV